MEISTRKKNLVLHTWTDFNGLVWVRYETPSGEIKTDSRSVNWYFLVQDVDWGKAQEIILSTGISTSPTIVDGGYIKVFCNDERRYDLVLMLEESKIPTYEGDLMNDRRWYIDSQVEISDSYKKLYFDIETDDSIPQIEIGRDTILSFAAVDSNGKTYFETIKEKTPEEEKKLLRKFLKVIKNYDIIMGWNSGEFDIPYLKTRMRKYDLHKTKEYCWKEIAHFDLLKRFRHIFRFDNQMKSFSLQNVSTHFLKKGKVVHDGKKIHEVWESDKDLLEEYNIEDCNLVRELDEKLGVSGMMIRQSQWCGVPAGQFGLYSIIDSYILRTAHKVKKYGRTSIPAIKERSLKKQRGNVNPDETDNEKAKYSGAIVLDPKIGRYDRVYTFDFKGLYPSMMRTSNIGYDSIRYEADRSYIMNPGTQSTIRKDGSIKPTFFTKELSVVTLAITDLIKKRSEYKKLKLKMIEDGTNKGSEWDRVVSDEIIVKELANSTYGIMGLSYGRYFSIDIAESITLFGQWCINFAKKVFEERGYDVIYGDTDSVFVSTGKQELDVTKELEIFHDRLKKELKEGYNIDEVFIELAFDKQYESLLLVNKKTYAGHVINIEGKKTDDIYTRGLEYIKKNTFSFASKEQKKLVEYILYKNPQKEDVKQKCKDLKDKFYKTEFEKEELILIQKIGRNLSTYKKTPPLHVRLSIEEKKKTGIVYARSEVEYIVTGGKDKKLEGVLAKDFSGKYDKDFYWENKTAPLLHRITESLYPDDNFFEPHQAKLF